MTKKEPSGEALLSARLARAYPALSAYSAARLAVELCAIERAQRRHAERCCSGAPDVRRCQPRSELFGYVKAVPTPEGRAPDPTCGHGMKWEHDPDAEARAGVRVYERVLRWKLELAAKDGRSIPEVDRAKPLHELTGAAVDLRLDPRGAVLLLRLPGEAEAVAV